MFSDQEYLQLRTATRLAVNVVTVKINVEKTFDSMRQKVDHDDSTTIQELEANIDRSKNDSLAAFEHAIDLIGQLRSAAIEAYTKAMVLIKNLREREAAFEAFAKEIAFLDKLSTDVREKQLSHFNNRLMHVEDRLMHVEDRLMRLEGHKE